jgi:hypothetical protein
MNRAGAAALILRWIPDGLHEDKSTRTNRPDIILDTSLARACFERACAANISLSNNSNRELEAIKDAIDWDAPAPYLTTLRIDFGPSNKFDPWDFLELPSFYPELVELSIRLGFVRDHITAHLPLLSRLQLEYVTIKMHPSSFIAFLQNSPLLTELLICYVENDYGTPIEAPSQQQCLHLPNLLRLVLKEESTVVNAVMTALTPLPLLQELVIESRHDSHSVLFQQAMTRWALISASAPPPAMLKTRWNPYGPIIERVSFALTASVCVGDHNTGSTLVSSSIPMPMPMPRPKLELTLPFYPSQMALYQQHGLTFDAIQIKHTQLFRAPHPWTEALDELLPYISSLGLEKLEFLNCDDGVAVLPWIREQSSKGRRIDKVAFKECDKCWEPNRPTFTDYEELRNSGLVEQVVWMK